MNYIAALMAFIFIIMSWQLGSLFLPIYILPSPYQVLIAGIQQYNLILMQAVFTIVEAMIGLLLALLLAMLSCFFMVRFYTIRVLIKPIFLISQALPTFAIAPLFVIWLGYGLASKIATTVLMLYFPIASAFFDGLLKTPSAYLALAASMQAGPNKILYSIRFPYAIPFLASGIRVASAMAMMAAVIGEWVGSSKGLGYLILNANARVQIPLMFACLVCLILLSLLLYSCSDYVLHKLEKKYNPV